MPFFTFKGINKKRVEEYSEKIIELSKIIDVDVNKIVFWHDEASLVYKNNNESTIQISIDWMSRKNKQDLVAKHLSDFFKNDAKHIYIKFNEINGFMYLNDKSLG